jgi:hypothetical protein
MNQDRFAEIVFHFNQRVVGVDFAREKILFLTPFAHRKAALWKSCGFVSR